MKINIKRERDTKNSQLLKDAIEKGENPTKAYARIYEAKYPSQGMSQWLKTHNFDLIKKYELKPKGLDKQD